MRAWIYDLALMGLTPRWYREVLARLPVGAHILDVGIGTGGAIARNVDLIRAKDLHILGLDVDADYLKQCNKAIYNAGLAERVVTRLESIYEHQGGPYDAVYFSASFPLLPDPVRALQHASTLMVPGNPIFFTQTFHHKKSKLLEKLKPMLHRFTTMHFGRVTYEEDFRRVLDEAGLELDELATMGRHTQHSSFRLAVGRVKVHEDIAVSIAQ
nr:class I SAM-dependent methyltransferase [Gammaproteobacteria bacterium]